jgi:membrane-bound metal-dependent hydrolase YbcI (DUF457 family)
MIAGHFGFAAAVKSRTPAVPVWALMLACVWLDVVFVPLLAAGLESIESVPGAPNGAYGAAIIHATYTHSLLGALVLSALFGLAFLGRYGRHTAFVLGLVVMSHWLLDLPMHRPDMPLLPGGIDPVRLGFGLWRFPVASAVLELALVVAGAALYWRAVEAVTATHPEKRALGRACAASVLGAGILTLVLNVLGF